MTHPFSKVGDLDEGSEYPSRITVITPMGHALWSLHHVRIEGPQTKRQNAWTEHTVQLAARREQERAEYAGMKAKIYARILNDPFCNNEYVSGEIEDAVTLAVTDILAIHAEWCEQHHDY